MARVAVISDSIGLDDKRGCNRWIVKFLEVFR